MEGGWTSKRHFNHPTQDIPLAELPRTRHFLNTDGLPKRIYPMLGQAFKESLPNWRALRVADAFVVKYDAANGQKALAKHRDGSVLSFNIALNERCEYVGGGTWFEGLGESIPIDQGHVCCHASGVLHGGHPITEGIRYILVAFVIVKLPELGDALHEQCMGLLSEVCGVLYSECVNRHHVIKRHTPLSAPHTPHRHTSHLSLSAPHAHQNQAAPAAASATGSGGGAGGGGGGAKKSAVINGNLSPTLLEIGRLTILMYWLM